VRVAPGAVAASARAFPQQDISAASSLYRVGFPGCEPLDDDGPGGKRRPRDQSVAPGVADNPRERKGNPETQTVRAVHQLPDHARSRSAPEPRDDFPRPIFRRYEMRDTPRGENGRHEKHTAHARLTP